MAITVNTDMVDVQILADAVRGRFRGKNALMGSILVSRGAVRVSGTMPGSGRSAIGKKIDIPYFGTLGKFVANADGSAVTPQKVAQVLEQATVARLSLAAEVSVWAQGLAQVDPAVGDPYEEAVNQLEAAAVIAMDETMVAEMKGTELVLDVYNATTPVYNSWDLTVDAKTLWGDEQDNIVAMVVHSQSLADMAKEKNSNGNSLLLVNNQQGAESIQTYNGVPVLVSDKVPLDGSAMGAVTSSGTSPPVATLTGTPLGPWKLVIDAITGDATTITFRFSTDGGNTWSVSTLTAQDNGTPVALTDTAVDSLVGVNGATGISVAFASGTFNADNLWKAKANLKVTDMILQQDAGGFWFNAAALAAQFDKDILADADIAAMHLYCAPKRYRRRRAGSRPGVVAIKHNVKGFTGVVDF
jgi:hypothetical protein